MAQPTTPIEIWAESTLNLPVAGKPNKQRPINDLWSKGYDKGQKPACEEFNYVLNMMSAWLKYIVAEGLPQYLPKNGTTINFTGDLSGNASFVGNSIITANIQVVDNSHNHVSSNITDASYTPTANVIPKRGSDGTLTCARNMIGYAPTGNNFDYRIYDNVTNTQVASMAWSRSLDCLNLYTGDSSDPIAGIYIFGKNGGYVAIDNPRSRNPQEQANASLVRYDYLNSRLTGLQNTLQTQIDRIDNGFVQDNRLGPQYSKVVNKDTPTLANSGGVMVGWYYEGDNPGGDTIYYRPVQKYYNNGWVTVSQT